MEVAVAKRPLPGLSFCGDDAKYWMDAKGVLLCIVDGLGHGREAEEAAQAVISYVEVHRQERLEEILAGCDLAVRHTRGAAVGLARLDPLHMRLTYAGVGNTALLLWRGSAIMRFASSNGIIGAGFRRVMPETVRLSAGTIGVMHTDGISNQIEPAKLRRLPWQDLQAFAQHLLDRFSLAGDDAAVITFRVGASE